MSDGFPDYDTLMERRNHYVTGISAIIGRLKCYALGEHFTVGLSPAERELVRVVGDLGALLDTEVSATAWAAPSREVIPPTRTDRPEVITPRMTNPQPVASQPPTSEAPTDA